MRSITIVGHLTSQSVEKTMNHDGYTFAVRLKELLDEGTPDVRTVVHYIRLTEDHVELMNAFPMWSQYVVTSSDFKQRRDKQNNPLIDAFEIYAYTFEPVLEIKF